MHSTRLALALCGLLLAPAASAIPMNVVHQGRLMDSTTGDPLDGQQTLNMAFFDAPAGGTALWTDDIVVDADNGFYTATLGLTTPLPASTFDVPVFLQLGVNGGPALTRIPVNSVPYAYKTIDAQNVRGGTVDATEIRVNGTTVIDGDGNYLGAVSDTLSELSCAHNGLVRWNNTTGAWACSTETLLSLSCTHGQVPTYNTSLASWECSNGVTDADVIAIVEGSSIDLAAGSTIGGSAISTLDAAGVQSIVEGTAMNLDSGTTIGGAAVSTMTASDVESIVNSTTLVLDSSTTIGGQPIATTADITWSNLAGIPSGFADDIDDELTEAEVETFIANGSIDLADGSTVQGDFDVTGDLSVSGNWSANGLQLGNDTSSCDASKEGTLRWNANALEACSENVARSGGTTYEWISAQGKPVVWSGGCTSHHHSTSWGKYCLNGTDFDASQGYFTVASSGDVTVNQSGYYRVHWWAIQHGCGAKRVRWFVNGTQRAYIHNDASTSNYWTHHSLDQIWPFQAGDTWYIDALANSCDGYAWHSWNANGSHSRLQFEYVGPL